MKSLRLFLWANPQSNVARLLEDELHLDDSLKESYDIKSRTLPPPNNNPNRTLNGCISIHVAPKFFSLGLLVSDSTSAFDLHLGISLLHVTSTNLAAAFHPSSFLAATLDSNVSLVVM